MHGPEWRRMSTHNPIRFSHELYCLLSTHTTYTLIITIIIIISCSSYKSLILWAGWWRPIRGVAHHLIIWVCGPRVRYWGWRYINAFVHIKILYNHAFINNDIMVDKIMVGEARRQNLTYKITNKEANN